MVVIPLISDLCVYTMKTLSIFGTRPEAIQMALVIKGLEQRPQNEPICKQKAFQPLGYLARHSLGDGGTSNAKRSLPFRRNPFHFTP
jgi:hypothetical protein